MAASEISTFFGFVQIFLSSLLLSQYFDKAVAAENGNERKWSIKCPGKRQFQIRSSHGGKFIISPQIYISIQVHLSAQLQQGSNLNKTERRTFVINVETNFGRNFVIFVKNYLPDSFFFFNFLNSSISVQLRFNTQSEHGTIMRTGITCKKIPCYKRDSACRWFCI